MRVLFFFFKIVSVIVKLKSILTLGEATVKAIAVLATTGLHINSFTIKKLI